MLNAEGVCGRNGLCFEPIERSTKEKMTVNNEWRPFIWHCVNCGCIVTGFKNNEGKIKVECKRCRTVMVRILKNKRKDTIDVFAPQGQERI